MGAPPICPHCGYNFERDEPVEIDGWRLTPFSIEHGGRTVKVSRALAGIAFAVARSAGEPISREALLNRVSDSEDPNLVSVLVSKLRHSVPDIPIETAWGRGYRWAA